MEVQGAFKMATKSGLTGGEVLEKAYELLLKKYQHKTINFPNTASAEIADDSDWHRSKTGYMGYKSAAALKINDKSWVLGLGEKCGSYPAEPFDKDILALEYVIDGKKETQISDELEEKIRCSPYFRNTVILSMADGQLQLGNSDYPCFCRFGSKMKELLKNKFKDYVAQKPEYDTEVILASTMDFPCRKLMEFKPEFVEVLADTIEKVLSNPPAEK